MKKRKDPNGYPGGEFVNWAIAELAQSGRRSQR